MIRFDLVCDKEHDFDGWFASSEAFESQRKRGLIACPECHSVKVGKSLMAPSVSTRRAPDVRPVAQAHLPDGQLVSQMRKLRKAITQHADDVGNAFPEEARKIHYGEVPERAVYGKASREEVKSLLDEGVGVAPLPPVPEDAN